MDTRGRQLSERASRSLTQHFAQSDVTASQWACMELVLCCVRMGVGGRRKAGGEVMGMYLRIYEENQAEKRGRRELVRW